MIEILIPTYEPNPNHLHAAIKSALGQTLQDWTMLIHDDASHADVRGMVEPFMGDARIRFVRSPVRLGIGGNWNACLKLSTASLIQFLFQDDLWEPQYLEEMSAVLHKHPSAAFASAEHHYACEEGMDTEELYKQVRTFRKEQIANGLHDGEEFLQFWIERQLHPNVIGEPSFVMLRRETIDAVGPFAEDLPQFLDVEYWLRCLQHGDWFYLNADLGSFRVHSKGASAQNQESGAGVYDRLDCFQRLIRSLHGDLKQSAITARNAALVSMAQKFLKRVQSGKNTPVASSGKFKKFALRHPFLMVRSLVEAILKRGGVNPKHEARNPKES